MVDLIESPKAVETTLEDKKPFWKSKTFWLNTAGLAQIALPMIGIPTIPMDDETTGIVLTVGNVALRSITGGRITLK